LKRHGVPGISCIDTRALVRRIRDGGAQVGLLSTDPDADEADLAARAKAEPGLDGRDLVADVSCSEPYVWDEGLWRGVSGQVPRAERPTPA
ncbi:MAG: carbamoyl phosphate synthase small subunit, partial [Deltaproteobacteria bacterium]|nr:carbamoyl phosphate synthase small subunit [Deltaproteobacteria bacterium]